MDWNAFLCFVYILLSSSPRMCFTFAKHFETVIRSMMKFSELYLIYFYLCVEESEHVFTLITSDNRSNWWWYTNRRPQFFFRHSPDLPSTSAVGMTFVCVGSRITYLSISLLFLVSCFNFRLLFDVDVRGSRPGWSVAELCLGPFQPVKRDDSRWRRLRVFLHCQGS